MALKWIQQNIEQFGGDPRQVVSGSDVVTIELHIETQANIEYRNTVPEIYL